MKRSSKKWVAIAREALIRAELDANFLIIDQVFFHELSAGIVSKPLKEWAFKKMGDLDAKEQIDC